MNVHSHGPMFTIDGNWTLAVYLEPPSIHSSVRQAFWVLQDLIYNYNYTDWVSTSIKDAWIMRSGRIKETLKIQSRRHKRSPLDFIGDLSHILFGTVTERELGDYKKALLKLNHAVNGTIHVSNKLLSVTRQVQKAVTHNSQHILALRHFLAKFRNQINRNQQIIVHRVDRLEQRSLISNLLATLEAATREITDQMAALHAWKQALTFQHLDDSILPPDQLAPILAAAKSKGYSTPSMEWIYTFIQIIPVWKDPSRLLFKVSLPLYTSTSGFLTYSFRSWPLYTKPGLKAQLLLEPLLAVSTNSKSAFIPGKCVGRHPTLCVPGSMMDNTKFRCERSLIGQDPAGRVHCAVRILKVNSSQSWPLGSGIYILSSIGEKAVLRCRGKPGHFYNLQPAVYQVRIPGSCFLEATHWSLLGMETLTSSLHVHQTTVKVPVFHTVRQLSSSQLQALSQVPDWVPLKDIPQVLPADITPLPPLSFVERHGILPILNSSGTMCAFILVVLLIGYLVRRYLKKKTTPPQTSCSPPAKSAPSLFIYPRLEQPTAPQTEPSQ